MCTAFTCLHHLQRLFVKTEESFLSTFALTTLLFIQGIVITKVLMSFSRKKSADKIKNIFPKIGNFFFLF